MLYIIPTIDVEGVHGRLPYDQMVFGRVSSGDEYGVGAIADIFSEFRLNATFFVDVYEHTLYGERLIRDACEVIMTRNQDVQLHTHPAWRDDKRDFREIRKMKRERSYFPQTKDFMFKCTLEEQIEIIEHGVGCLEKWIGLTPVGHRAGGYGINKDTITALRKVGICVDSSMLHSSPNCKLNWSVNKIIFKEGITEVPITGFAKSEKIRIGTTLWKRQWPFIKTDLDSCSLDNLLWFVGEALEHEIGIMTLFLHSYSLLRFDKKFRYFNFDSAKANKLKRFLSETAGHNDIEYISIADFALKEKSLSELNRGRDYIPKLDVVSSGIPLIMNKIFGKR